MSSNFVHLHVHSQYSLLQGAIEISALVKQVKAMGMPAVALTDHVNLFGAVEFYEKARSEGIQPILGCEVYVLMQGSCLEKSAKFRERDLTHLLLLVQNAEGYKNLCRLLTLSYSKGFYYKPRLDKQVLKEHSQGLIALSCCSKGEIPRKIIEGDLKTARQATIEYAEIFPERFYLELADHGLPHEKLVNETLADFAQTLSLPEVATNNVHYLHQMEREAHEVLLCIQSGNKLKEEDRPSYEGEEFYLKSPQEMVEIFSSKPSVIKNSFEIANRCSFDFDFKTYYFPQFELEAEKTPEEFLREKVYQGFEERWPPIAQGKPNASELRQFYLDRIELELQTILSMGFASYFLIVSDFINYAKSQAIPVGPGRGSAAGSIVAYCLKITDLDPIPYHLLFERFLNPERISMPDMDIDFCMNRRDEVIRYVNQKYGSVAQIITFGKMKAKAVIRDVGRVLDLPYADVDKIAKLVPNTLNITLEEALKVEPRLKELENSNSQVKKLLKIARSLEGLTRHASTHAAGVVISDRPLTEFMPLYRGSRDETVTQFDMKAVEKIGLVKFDFLGLTTLSVIDEALRIVRKTRKTTLDINTIPLDDPAVYQTLCSGNGLGIFQLESSGMRDLLTKLKPSTFEDIIALVALYRPGPLGSGMVDDFINRKHGRTLIEYELPQLEPILKDTYGVIVYQEQVMQIASALAGFSLGEADLLRRAMGKKKPEEMAQQRERFLRGAQQKKIPSKKAEKIFDLMAKFAEYGFNKSHSAAYALVSYQTAYLKTHFMAEYMAALLTHEMGNSDKILIYINDLQTFGVAVLPPDLNESTRYFSVLNEKEIRFGLAAVKNVGDAAIESILEARTRVGKFYSLKHFCEEIDSRKVNKKVIESLIKCGAFDQLGICRAEAMKRLDAVMEEAAAKQRDQKIGQNSLFEALFDAQVRERENPGEEWPEPLRLKNEKEVLGFYITGHPLKSYAEKIAPLQAISTASLKETPDKSEVKVVGIVNAFKEIQTKKGDRMAFVTLEDLHGQVEVVVFADVYKTAQKLIREDEPIFVAGQLDLNEESAKILASQIISLKEADSLVSRAVQIQTSFHALSPAPLQDLKKILLHHPGAHPVYLRVLMENREEKILELPPQLEVEWSERLKEEIQNLLGEQTEVRLFER